MWHSMLALVAVLSPGSSLDLDHHFEFSGGFYSPLPSQVEARHQDLMWGLGVDSFFARNAEVVESARNRSKEYILKNGCPRKDPTRNVTCHTQAEEQDWLNGSTGAAKPRFVELQQFAEVYNFAEQKIVLDKAKEMYPDTTFLVSHPNAPESEYREFLSITGSKDLLLCNYPGFGYQNDIFEDVLFYTVLLPNPLDMPS